MPLFLSHVAVKIRGLRSVYIVYGAKVQPYHSNATTSLNQNHYGTQYRTKWHLHAFPLFG